MKRICVYIIPFITDYVQCWCDVSIPWHDTSRNYHVRIICSVSVDTSINTCINTWLFLSILLIDGHINSVSLLITTIQHHNYITTSTLFHKNNSIALLEWFSNIWVFLNKYLFYFAHFSEMTKNNIWNKYLFFKTQIFVFKSECFPKYDEKINI